MEKNLVHNSVICLECGETLVSFHTHDYKTCSCDNETMVDGGLSYGRYGGKDLSKVRTNYVYDDDNIIAQLSNGTRLTVLEEGKNWTRVKVVSSGLTGYVVSSMISYGSTPSDTKTVVQPKGLYVNLRSGPDYSYKVVCRMPTGAKITVISKGEQWSKVMYGSYTGYMVNDFIK